jgi:type IV pilus assembly protein PilX
MNLYEMTVTKHVNNKAMLQSHPAHQSGVVLIISLIMLLLLTLIGTAGMRTTSLEEKMAGNMRDKNLAFQAAESALNAAEVTLDVATVDLPTFADDGAGGFYTAASTLPTATALLTDSFWATPTKVIESPVTGLGNGIQTPVYIIQEMPSACFEDCATTPVIKTPYKITVRATGASTNTVVILQSIYTRS